MESYSLVVYWEFFKEHPALCKMIPHFDPNDLSELRKKSELPGVMVFLEGWRRAWLACVGLWGTIASPRNLMSYAKVMIKLRDTVRTHNDGWFYFLYVFINKIIASHRRSANTYKNSSSTNKQEICSWLIMYSCWPFTQPVKHHTCSLGSGASSQMPLSPIFESAL